MSFDAAQAVELAREALHLMLLLAAPLLLVVMVTGLVVGVAQALTQVQDQTLNVVPRLFAAAVAVLVLLPWMVTRMIEYTSTLFEAVPNRY